MFFFRFLFFFPFRWNLLLKIFSATEGADSRPASGPGTPTDEKGGQVGIGNWFTFSLFCLHIHRMTRNAQCERHRASETLRVKNREEDARCAHTNTWVWKAFNKSFIVTKGFVIGRLLNALRQSINRSQKNRDTIVHTMGRNEPMYNRKQTTKHRAWYAELHSRPFAQPWACY